ncbi:MAG: oxygenase MpaB family protein [Lacisediminihabitans sp.]
MSDVAGEAVLLAGGARAILLQIADPGVGEGVARHSDFASDPMRRLRNTLTYIYVVVYGTADDQARVVAMVNAAHQSVRGPRYDAVDPQLQLWVAATLYDTAITVYESVFGVLSPNDADALYLEYAVLGTALQVPPELWPDDRAAFHRYWNSQLARLRVTDDTRRVAHDLLHSHAFPWWLQAGMPLARLVTAGLLTPSLRVACELPWDARRQRRYERAMRVTAALYPRLPRSIRHWPMRHYLRAFHHQ